MCVFVPVISVDGLLSSSLSCPVTLSGSAEWRNVSRGCWAELWDGQAFCGLSDSIRQMTCPFFLSVDIQLMPPLKKTDRQTDCRVKQVHFIVTKLHTWYTYYQVISHQRSTYLPQSSMALLSEPQHQVHQLLAPVSLAYSQRGKTLRPPPSYIYIYATCLHVSD